MLNRDDVLRMTEKVGIVFREFRAGDNKTILSDGSKTLEVFEAFAAAAYAAGKADERKRILSICNEVSAEWFNYSGGAVECIRRIEEMK